MALFTEAQLACLPTPGLTGLDVLVLAFGDESHAAASTPVLSASARAAAKSVRELRVSGACPPTEETTSSADVVLVADGVLAALARASTSERLHAQAIAFTTEALRALRERGHLLLVAQCFAHEEVAHSELSPLFVSSVIQAAAAERDASHAWKFEVDRCHSTQAADPFALVWLAQKVAVARSVLEASLSVQGDASRHNPQLVLDALQYSAARLRQYEFIFGAGHTGTGGDAVAEEVGRALGLGPKSRALEVASGLGGSAFAIAKSSGARVTGLDLCCNMVGLAFEKLYKLDIPKGQVHFEVGNAVTTDMSSASYDAAYSRDAILHIPFELRVPFLQNTLKALRPGGKMIAIDYCCGNPETMPNELKEYFDSRGYHVTSLAVYKKHFEDAGFKNVVAENRTALFVEKTEEELQHFLAHKKEFIAEFGEDAAAEYDTIAARWRFKLVHCATGAFVWGWVSGEKSE